MSEQVLH